jgi:hypothetical protein
MGIKTVTSKVQNNLIGTIAGAGIAYWAGKKYLGVSGMLKVTAVVLVGALAGAYAQSMIAAKKSAPTAGSTK